MQTGAGPEAYKENEKKWEINPRLKKSDIISEVEARTVSCKTVRQKETKRWKIRRDSYEKQRNDHDVSTNGYLTFKKIMAYDFPELKKDIYGSSDWKATLNTNKLKTKQKPILRQ